MAIADELKELREEFDDCNLVAFADLTSKMVLLSNSPKKVAQENLDQLCTEAAALFIGAAAKLNKDGAPLVAMVTDGNKSNIYLRNKPDGEDVLCCVCGPDVDLNGFLTSARARLDQIMPGDES